MLRFIGRRFVNYAVLVVVATSLAYLLASKTLDPVGHYEHGGHVNLTAVHHRLRELNIDPDTPIWSRYWRWLTQILLHGDFGKSFPSDGNVTTLMGNKIGVSLRLLLAGSILSVSLGVLIGVYGALHHLEVGDHIVSVMSFVLMSVPVFLLATLVKTGAITLYQHFGITWLPTSGEYSPGQADDLLNRIDHLILPTVVLVVGAGGAAFFGRYQRSAMIDVLDSDFMRTAQAKGLSRQRALLKHGLRTALIPMATFFAFQFGTLIVGAVFTETVFNWHGMGAWSIETIQNDDINGISAVVAFTAVLVLMSGVLADVCYAVLDPRVRVG